MLLFPRLVRPADLPDRSAVVLVPQTLPAGGLWLLWRRGHATMVGTRFAVPVPIWRTGLPVLGVELAAVWAEHVPDHVLAAFEDEPPTTHGEALARIHEAHQHLCDLGHGLLTLAAYGLYGLRLWRR